MRLYIIVEGETEEYFVRHVLEPHLASLGIATFVSIVAKSRDRHGTKQKGGGDWTKWRDDLVKLMGEQRGTSVRFTTLFDLYGLPKNFPGFKTHGAVADTNKRAALLEEAMKARVNNDWRFIPYLQRHEFEALVLAGLDKLNEVLDVEDRPALLPLQQLLRVISPEEVNDGEETAPSKRLEAAILGYKKSVHVPLAIESIGLAALRARCPRFSEWLTKLEALAPEDSKPPPSEIQ
ncbi:DUF4276 family protein [Chondromyces apiculatus]|uniref:DUF4276 family protein n=1 Tax=Chondromyces apiculatus DSM 436 TaxID=1192034 RepID=A0A017SXA1_9BACT|nr:DUF4276 family protein [Chondromyces apiculatus]EYF00946.1 Hypothetical protein CAP_8894 [Chondromyces apiculatus DSM 436]